MSRFLIASAGDLNVFYIGECDYSVDAIKNPGFNGWITLRNARILMHNAGMMMGPRGPGISISNRMWPFPFTLGSATIHIKPTVLIDPEDNPEMREALAELGKSCGEMEVQMRAESAGLVTAPKVSP
jgi:hypothetical protein